MPATSDGDVDAEVVQSATDFSVIYPPIVVLIASSFVLRKVPFATSLSSSNSLVEES
jgi:hypothetical protein